MRMTRLYILIAVLAFICSPSVVAQRKITPVNTPATATQPINEFEGDTARINKRMRETMVHYHDENGNIVYVDTITGREWRDSTVLKIKQPMAYPLFESVTIGVDIWNPAMRAFGQNYGLIDFMVQVSLHNRYKPTVEIGLGTASNTPADNNFTYKSPLSTYFKIGIDYNFLFNSSTDYQFFAGLRLGYAPFKFSLTDVTIPSSYWDETAHLTIPSQTTSVLWWEFAAGLRVKLWGPIAAGWMLRYHNIAHEKKLAYGQPWYIPGYGSRAGALTGSFYITYTFALNKKKAAEVKEKEEDLIFLPQSSGQPSPEQIEQGLDAEAPE